MTDTARRTRRPLHLADHLAVLRRHWWSAALVFLLVVGGILTQTVLSTPVYNAAATVHLTSAGTGGGLLADLAEVERPSEVETEMEVIRSFSVARGAARIYAAGGAKQAFDPQFVHPTGKSETGLPHAPVSVTEVNAYRPWEVYLRGWGVGRAPASPLTVKTPPLPPGVASIALTLHFDEEARHVRVNAADGTTSDPIAFQLGEPFQALDREFVLEHKTGNLGGRTYAVGILSVPVAADWIHDSAVVSPVGRQTGIVMIGYQSGTPHVARDVADALAASYLALRRLQRTEELGAGLSWLNTEIDRLTADLTKSERALDEYIASKGAVHLGERTRSMLTNIQTLEEVISSLKYEMSGLSFQRDRLSGEMPLDKKLRLLGDKVSNPVTLAHAQDYVTMTRRRDALRRDGKTNENLIVKELNIQIEEVRKELEAAAGEIVRSQVATLNQKIETIRSRIADSEADLERHRGTLDQLPELERGLARLTREVEARKVVLEELVQRRMQLDIANNSTHISARLVDSARLPLVRSSPRLFHKAILALMLGLLAAVGLAFFLEYLDRRIKTPQELEEGLGLPIYATIPAFRSVRRRERRGLRGALVVHKKPNSLLAEAYRSLRANIRFADADREVRVLAITSALPQEGKTVTTLNLATTMAQSGNSVIVVDADLRRPATHTHLGGEQSPGLTDVLSGKPWREVVRETEIPNLSVIPAGQRVNNPGALLDSKRLQALLGELRENFDNVLFDVPPILAVSDAAVFFRKLDGVLLLVQYHRARIEVVEGARDQVARMGGRLLGVIFNAYDARRSSQSGYGRYGYGDRYSAYGSDVGRGKRSRTATSPAPKS